MISKTHIVEFESLNVEEHEELCRALTDDRLKWAGVSLARLGRLATNFEIACEPFTPAYNDTGSLDTWKASRWVGHFLLDGEAYSISPRVGWARFLLMLEGAISVGIQEGGSVQRGNEGNLAPLVWVLLHEMAWRHHRGPAKAFVRRHEHDAFALRGQLNLGEQLIKLNNSHTIACEYDELTYDHSVNRGTLLAIKRLRQDKLFPFNGSTSYDVMARAWSEALMSAGVESPSRFPKGYMRWSRANDGFRAAHAIAEMVVDKREGRANIGRGPASFLFDSAEVWELYLFRQLVILAREWSVLAELTVEWPRERLGPPDTLLKWQGRDLYAQFPDIRLIGDKGRVELVIDAKYRIFKAPTETDVDFALQMFRYAATANREADDCWPPTVLLYPSCEGLNPSERRGPLLKGKGRFNVSGEPNIAAWAIELPTCTDAFKSKAEFHSYVRNQLKEVITAEIGKQ